MELIWKRLLQVMQKTVESCRKMADLACRQRQAIMHEQIQEIGELVLEQENEMKDFQSLEQEREALIRGIGQELKLSGEELKSSRLLDMVPPEWSNDYRRQVEELKKETAQVREEHAVNRKLLQHSQQFMSWLVNYLVTPQGAEPVYNAAGGNSQKSYYHIINQNI